MHFDIVYLVCWSRCMPTYIIFSWSPERIIILMANTNSKSTCLDAVCLRCLNCIAYFISFSTPTSWRIHKSIILKKQPKLYLECTLFQFEDLTILVRDYRSQWIRKLYNKFIADSREFLLNNIHNIQRTYQGKKF